MGCCLFFVSYSCRIFHRNVLRQEPEIGQIPYDLEPIAEKKFHDGASLIFSNDLRLKEAPRSELRSHALRISGKLFALLKEKLGLVLTVLILSSLNADPLRRAQYLNVHQSGIPQFNNAAVGYIFDLTAEAAAAQAAGRAA